MYKWAQPTAPHLFPPLQALDALLCPRIRAQPHKRGGISEREPRAKGPEQRSSYDRESVTARGRLGGRSGRRRRQAAKGALEMKEKGSRAAVDERYAQWKSLIPVLYDWFANHNLVWPSLSCRDVLKLKFMTDGTVPNTLVIANCEVVKPRVAAAEHISQFNEEARSPFVKKYKTIIHPGEVNRIRELPQNSKIIATHTDSPDVLIWDVEAQPNRQAQLAQMESRPDLVPPDSRPDLILRGHKDIAEFALAMCPAEPYVLSGGKDKSVVWWSIQDHISALGDSSKTESSPGASGSKGKIANDKDSPKVDPRGIFLGHDSTVEDVQFCPSSAQEFCSVGDDSCLILWDARTGTSPAVKVEKAHGGDVHCVDWNLHDVNYILTGYDSMKVLQIILSVCGTGEIWVLEEPAFQFTNLRVIKLLFFVFRHWSPDKASVFGSSAEDGFLNVWDHEKVGNKKNPNAPAGLFFQHAGHRDKIVDFHWNSSDPWTIVSVSDDGESTGGGGTLQIWRMSDLIYRPEDEVLAELENFKTHLASCAPRS
uniref:Histone-binding protein RBBP4-like N-terminal domain-containing protein n=1 Tax=Oryza punctata TaxID=4537 RepID=A0A0E0JN42_ORYPU